MLSSRVDLTENRDFAAGADMSTSDIRALADTLAFEYEHMISIDWSDVDADGNNVLVPHKAYPWNMFKLDSDTAVPEILYSADPLSNSLGLEFWDDVDHPFLLGSKGERKFARDIINEEMCLACHRCGKILNVLDEFSSPATLCARCSQEISERSPL